MGLSFVNLTIPIDLYRNGGNVQSRTWRAIYWLRCRKVQPLQAKKKFANPGVEARPNQNSYWHDPLRKVAFYQLPKKPLIAAPTLRLNSAYLPYTTGCRQSTSSVIHHSKITMFLSLDDRHEAGYLPDQC
jgi:hypothetical protein